MAENSAYHLASLEVQQLLYQVLDAAPVHPGQRKTVRGVSIGLHPITALRYADNHGLHIHDRGIIAEVSGIYGSSEVHAFLQVLVARYGFDDEFTEDGWYVADEETVKQWLTLSRLKDAIQMPASSSTSLHPDTRFVDLNSITPVGIMKDHNHSVLELLDFIDEHLDKEFLRLVGGNEPIMLNAVAVLKLVNIISNELPLVISEDGTTRMIAAHLATWAGVNMLVTIGMRLRGLRLIHRADIDHDLIDPPTGEERVILVYGHQEIRTWLERRNGDHWTILKERLRWRLEPCQLFARNGVMDERTGEWRLDGIVPPPSPSVFLDCDIES